MPMPYTGKDVPHAVIEVNAACNISCTACYKSKSKYQKSLEQIKEEIDFARGRRRLRVVTLAGGEPTLHPDLPRVIEYLHRHGIGVQMLSNGLSLTDELLQTYKKAGLQKIYLHIDSMQKRADIRDITCEEDLMPLREKIARMVARNGIRCGLEITLYQRTLPELSSIVDFVVSRRDVHRMLVTCCTDFEAVGAAIQNGSDMFPSHDAGGSLQGEVVSLRQVAEILRREHGMRPYAYIASDRNPDAWRWILYYTFVVSTPDGRYWPLQCGPSFQRIVSVANFVSKKLRGRYPFDNVLTGISAAALCALYAVTSFDFVRSARLLSKLLQRGARIDQKGFIFQEGPSVTSDGEIEWCAHCPDATVRNGRLVPVCAADYISPIEQPHAVEKKEHELQVDLPGVEI